MTRFNDSIFNQASDNAMSEALLSTLKQKEAISGSKVFTDILNQLEQSAVNKDEIKSLEKEINDATNKNKVIADVLGKGGDMAVALQKIIKSFL